MWILQEAVRHGYAVERVESDEPSLVLRLVWKEARTYNAVQAWFAKAVGDMKSVERTVTPIDDAKVGKSMWQLVGGRGQTTISAEALEPGLFTFLLEDLANYEVPTDPASRLEATATTPLQVFFKVVPSAPDTINGAKAAAAGVLPRLDLFRKAWCLKNEQALNHWQSVVRQQVKRQQIDSPNAAFFEDSEIEEWALCFGTLQMYAHQETFVDGAEHYDGGASLIHGCITYRGTRGVRLVCQDGSEEVLRVKPGTIYFGDLSAISHNTKFNIADGHSWHEGG